ncbi:DUF6362 family protein [Endozoicomonas sp. ALD040]|uniref:DUF6362 family protein n=1 Tax=Endozoicomonas sp. ALD040 TaxID=3403079 RepID=UPI003BB168B3
MECKDELAHRYREAWLVARRVSSGINLRYSAFWPESNPNRWEVYQGENKILRLPEPSEDEVDRMVKCMRWLRWVSEEERKLIWLRASGLPWRVIADDLGVNRKTAYGHWCKAINRISIHILQKNSG